PRELLTEQRQDRRAVVNVGERVVGGSVLELLTGTRAVGDVQHAGDRAAHLAAGARERADAHQRAAPGAGRAQDVHLYVAVDALGEDLAEHLVELGRALLGEGLEQRRDGRSGPLLAL